MCAALRVALEQEPRHLLDKQRHAASSLAHSIDNLVGERKLACDLADHAAHLHAVERRERNDAMVRAQGPGRPEFRPRGGDDKQGGLGAALPKRAQEIEGGRIGPVQVLESEDNRLRPRSSQNPSGHRRQLSSPQLFRRETGGAAGWERDVHERREQRRMFGWVEADQAQRVFEVGETLFGRRIHTKTLPTPFGDWMQRRVLQQRRGAPFDPGVSDCLAGQAIFHGDFVRAIALRIVRSCRRQAMMATFLGSASVDEAVIGGADDRVVADGGKGGHVQDVADGRSSAADHSMAAPGAEIAVERRDADESGELSATEPAEFGQFGDEGSRSHRADAGDGREQVFRFAPCGRGANIGVDVSVDGGELLLRKATWRSIVLASRLSVAWRRRLASMPIISTTCRRLATSSPSARASKSALGEFAA